ncbi:Vacuolar protein sorting-associated protein [Quillaja saponaria]|uniref:Vacuolar protein sorting-associated protein n=1 Tax=Quillaja saponaria TaxID=32244 RepID=A0AAD7L789_QUISA|nr:Vacuolar protein sorting-associated protein [Quillaja saponaria]
MLMPLSNIIRRRLLRLLQPWLRELPEFEVKLGLKKSCAVARNLQIDTSVLNQLFDEPAGLFFKDVTIEHLTVRFSLWSSTAFTVEVHGVHITLSPGEQNEEGYLKRLRKRDTSSGNVTKKLSALDPEGCSLHCLLERILCTVPSGNEFSTTLLNLILKHCHLEMHKIHVDVKFPILNDVVMGFWELKEFNARSKSLDHGCLLRGIFGALFFPLKENPFIICGIGFKIRFGRNDHTDRVLLSSDLFTCINLSDLKLVDFRLQVPELVLSFSPDDISICLAFSKLLSDNPKHIRSGRQLWRLAASKIGHLTVTPRVALYKLVGVVVQWLEYVIAYESLLLLIGYSTDQLLKRSIVEMSQDRLTLASAKHQWKVISGIEKELPAEGIALGRRVARHRAALNGQCAHSLKKSSVSSPFNFLCLFLLVLSIIWKKMCNILRSIGKFLKLVQDPKIYGQMGIVCEGPFEKFCFILNLKKVIITVFPMSEIQPSVNEKLQSQLGLPYSDFLIFCVSINALSLAYVEDIYEWNLFMSCGQLEIKPSFLGGSSVLQTSTANVLNSGKGHRTGASNDMKSILWVEPAQRSLVSESNAEGSCDPFLESLLREMWSNWKRVCMSFDEGEIEYTENLFLLCEMESSLAYPGLKNTDYGFCKYSLTLGKLNLDMTYSSILSASLLLSQMQHAFLGNKDKGRVRVHLDSRVKPELCWGSKYECFSVGLIMTIFGMLPEKHIQLGVFVAGPCIQLSCDKKLDGTDEHKGDIVSQDDIQLTFQLHDIEAAVWSPSIFDMAPLTGMTGLEGIVKECPRLEPHTIEIPKPNNGKNVSHRRISVFSYIRVNGLNIHMGSTTENKQFQLFVLKPIIVQLSSIREFAYSLGTNVVTFSAAVGMMAAGFTAFSYMDELYLLCQVFVGLSSAVSYFFSCSESDGHVCPKLMRQEILFVEAENEQTTVGGASLTNCSCLFLINGTFRLESVDLILQRSRTSDNVDSFIKSYDALCSKNLVGQNWPDCGTWISFQQISIELSCEKGKMELLTDLSGIQALLFEHQNEMGIINDHIALNNLQLQSLNCLYEISLLDCKFTLGPPQSASSSTGVSKPLDNSNSGGDTSHMLEKPLLTINSGKPNDQSHSFVHEMGSTSSILSQPSCHWLLLNMALGNIFIGKCSMKDVLVGSHQLNKLLGILSVGGEFQTISWSVQGGLVVIETTVLAKFVCHFSSYLHCVSNIISAVRPSDKHILKADGDLSTINLNNHLTEVEARESLCTSQHDEGDFLNAVAVDVSKFSLALVLENESGDIGELVIEVDFRLKFERGNTGRKFLFDLSHLSILSQVLRGSVEDESETPHFSSVTSNVLSPHFVSGLPASGFQGSDEINSVNDASCSRDPLPFSLYSSVPKVFKLSHQNHILKHLSASMSVERPEYGPLHLRLVWFGTGSVSSFDITVTLSEVEMMLSMATSFSGVSSWDAKGESIKNHQSSSQRPDNSMEALVPDGAIVAIQDVHQHMYFTVEGGESNFSLGGAIHYSLVGERALFRVKYCKRRRWKSTVLWFSLISLYAKNTLGESLRLNYCPGSGFVDISSNTDGGGAVWRALPCEPESSMGVIDWEPYHQLVNRTLYLVNGKNDSGVAFVDEVPEFVRKPGSPFKLKVFHDLRDVVNTDSHPTMTSGTSLGMHEGITFQQGGKLPHVDIRIEEITLNIVHELSDTADLFPLLRGCINNTQLIIQTLPTKFRVISTFNAAVLYFVGQLNLWRQLLHPVDICFFYRSSFHSEGPEHASHGVPVNIYCRTKRLCISLSELSLDTLLFVIGKLNLSGPYPVRSFTILANCCKVENQSGLNLLCHFYDTQRVSISRKQSTSILLRKRSDLANQTLEVATPVSVQLVDLGSFATSSIRLSISEAQTLAWRTRIMSVKDSRTYPGPFLVASISRKTKDGLSVVISPLIKISNETGFSMELRFLRPQPNEDEFASVLLKPGDSIDDSMAMFDAIKLSGGVKKALMSLSVGNFLFSFRPEMTEDLIASKHSLSAEWSEDLKGGKAVVLSGIFDKLSYRVRRTLSVKSVKCSFSTASCALSSEGAWVSNMHFLIQTIGRDVPVIQPEKSKEGDKSENLPVALQEQKEIYLLPTVRVTNLLQSEIHVLLSETGLPNPLGCNSIGKQAAISCGCTVDFYANPAIIYFTVTLIASTSSSKPVNSGDLVKKLMKQKVDVHHLDIDLDFEGGAYFATLRLSRGNRGILEAVVFTSYALKNNTEYSVYVLATNKKHLFRNEVDRLKSDMPMERGLFLPPKSTRSWFLKSKKVQLKLPEDHTSEALLDLDALSGTYRN